jgi:hypothetical protein
MEMLLNFLKGGHFEPQNYSPKSGQEPICPLYGIIDVAKEFTGIDPSSFYCGHMVEHVDNIGLLSGRRGEDYNPHIICENIANDLELQIKTLQIDDRDISKLLTKTVDSLTEKELEVISSAKKLTAKKKEILERFKLATFNVTKVHVNDNSKDIHFRPVNSLEDISDEEAVNAAKNFLKALQKQTSKCPQMPRSGFSGEMS